MRRRALPLRARIILLVVAVAVLPLGLVGLWLTGSAARSGEALLRGRLRDALTQTASQLGTPWLVHRSALLGLGDHPDVQRVLAEALALHIAPTGMEAVGEDHWRPGAPVDADRRLQQTQADAGQQGQATSPSPDFEAAFAAVPSTIRALALLDAAGDTLWHVRRADTEHGGSGWTELRVVLPVQRGSAAERIGWIDARIAGETLLQGGITPPVAAGAVLAIIERESGTSLRPLPFHADRLAAQRFTWGGDEWVAERRTLREPAIELVAAAPTGPFTAPFEDAAQRGVWILLLAAAAATVAAFVLTRPMTATLRQLAAAAEGIATGDLERRVEPQANDELGRVAVAFNSMASSLESTLAELSHRRGLVAVGEFAAQLAHEVRNPLTSIRFDLQVVEERLEHDSEMRQVQHEAILAIDRLDRTVAGVLQLARSGTVRREPVELRRPLQQALRAAAPEFGSRSARVESSDDGGPAIVAGDADALQQVVLNILLNAAQSLPDGGAAWTRLATSSSTVTVEVGDHGRGIPPDELERVTEPFHSNRRGGTGLGLALADRVIAAHGGTLRIESEVGRGTRVTIELPRAGSV